MKPYSLLAVDTHKMSREDWLSYRIKGVGGSDAAAIIGLNPWSSPYRVWADKLHLLPPQKDNEAMRFGRDMEPYVAKRWSEQTGLRCQRRNQMMQSRQWPFALANIDYWVPGENAGLECKTTGSIHTKQFRGGAYPDQYYVQCVHYMAVTGARRWYLAVYIPQVGLFPYKIERDEAEIQALMEQEASFWELVRSKTPPPVDGTAPTTDTLQTIYAPAPGSAFVDLFGCGRYIQQYLDAEAACKETERSKEAAKQALMELLGNNTKGLCDHVVVKWPQMTRSSFDAQAFQADHPELDLRPFFKTTQYRKFTVEMRKEPVAV